MPNLDLFDDVRVTLHDVELWLRAVPRLHDGNRSNHVLDYCTNYDVINKIKKEKLANTFYSSYDVEHDDNQKLSVKLLPLINKHFKPLPILPLSMFKNRESRRA